MGLFGQTDQWRGICAASLTAFDGDGELDRAGSARQVRFLLDQGVAAICPGMHTGESPSLSLEERRLLIDLSVEEVAGRVPVAAHVSCAGTAHTVQLARYAEQAGAAAVVVVTPYYWRPSEDALYEHLVAVADSIGIDLVAYFYPGDATPALVERLIERLPNFLGVKTADLDIAAFTEICTVARDARPEMSVLPGVDYLAPTAAVGGAGAFSILSAVAPRLVARLWNAVENGDSATAVADQARASRLWDLLHGRFPAGIKAGADLFGRSAGDPRLPLLAYSAAERALLRQGVAALGLLDSEPHGFDGARLEGSPEPAAG